MVTESQEGLPAGWKVESEVQKNGQKIKYYMNCTTGQKFFSKEDLHRYVEMERSQLLDPQPSNGHGKRQYGNNIMTVRHLSEENDRPEWLPDGWVVELRNRKSGSAIGRQYKVYIDPMSGCKLFSKPEVLRYLESVKDRNLACKKKKTEVSLSSASKVVVEKSTVDDLPPGWIKETKITKTAHRIRRDPFYTDPVSRYVFQSKKDVFRYLKTGVISKNAFKPRKRADDQELINEEASPLPDAKRQKSEHHTTRRQLFPVKESSDVCSPALEEAEVLKRRRGKRVSAENGLAEFPTAEQMDKTGIKKGAETMEIPSLSSSAQPKFKGSKRKQHKKVCADNGSVSTSAIDSLLAQRLPESDFECNNGKSHNGLTKSEKKKTLNLPRRSSKRLAGLEPELVANWVSVEQTPDVTTKSCKAVAIPVACFTSCGLVDEVSQQLKAGSVMDHANLVSSEVNIPSSGEPSITIRSSGNQAIPGEQMQKLKSAKTNVDNSEHVSLYFGDSYLDPCLESAFKALMHEIPENSNPDNGPVSTPAADSLLEKKLQETKVEKSSKKRTRVNPTKSKTKQELNLPRRSSKRLAGSEPEMVANYVSIDRARKNVSTGSCKSKAISTSHLTSSGLVDEVSPQLKAGPLTGLASHLFSEVNIPSNGESSIKTKSLENQAIPGEQSSESNDDNSESRFSLPLGDSYLDPCKALMGEIPVNCVPLSTTAVDILLEKNLQETKVEKSSSKRTCINSTKSRNRRELKLPCRSSKRLAELEPELASNSISVKGCGNAAIEYCRSKARACAGSDPQGLAEGASQEPEAGHETMHAQHGCSDIGTPLNEDLSNKSSKLLEALTVPEEQSQKLENEKPGKHTEKLENERMSRENPDSLLFPFGDSWPDPCLEFAFKTLTGAIPVDDNMEFQDYFQHQLDPSQAQKDDSLVPAGFGSSNDSWVLPGFGSSNDSWVPPGFGSTNDSSVPPGFGSTNDSSVLPGLGSINSLQTDVPFLFDSLEKQPASQQQMPANPFPSPGNMSIPRCSGVASQPSLDGNKEFHGKVKS